MSAPRNDTMNSSTSSSDDEMRKLARTEHSRAKRHFDKDEFQEAIKLCQSSITTRQRISKLTDTDKENLDNCVRNLSVCYNFLGIAQANKEQYKEAIQSHQEAIETRKHLCKLTDEDVEDLDHFLRVIAYIQVIFGFKQSDKRVGIQLMQEAIKTTQRITKSTDEDKKELQNRARYISILENKGSNVPLNLQFVGNAALHTESVEENPGEPLSTNTLPNAHGSR